jgi:hypothetical protein
MTMPVTLALQAAALAFALVWTGPTSIQPTEGTSPPVTRTAAHVEAQHLHCRLYFGCAPAQKVSAVGVKD